MADSVRSDVPAMEEVGIRVHDSEHQHKGPETRH